MSTLSLSEPIGRADRGRRPRRHAARVADAVQPVADAHQRAGAEAAQVERGVVEHPLRPRGSRCCAPGSRGRAASRRRRRCGPGRRRRRRPRARSTATPGRAEAPRARQPGEPGTHHHHVCHASQTATDRGRPPRTARRGASVPGMSELWSLPGLRRCVPWLGARRAGDLWSARELRSPGSPSRCGGSGEATARAVALRGCARAGPTLHLPQPALRRPAARRRGARCSWPGPRPRRGRRARGGSLARRRRRSTAGEVVTVGGAAGLALAAAHERGPGARRRDGARRSGSTPTGMPLLADLGAVRCRRSPGRDVAALATLCAGLLRLPVGPPDEPARRPGRGRCGRWPACPAADRRRPGSRCAGRLRAGATRLAARSRRRCRRRRGVGRAARCRARPVPGVPSARRRLARAHGGTADRADGSGLRGAGAGRDRAGPAPAAAARTAGSPAGPAAGGACCCRRVLCSGWPAPPSGGGPAAAASSRLRRRLAEGAVPSRRSSAAAAQSGPGQRCRPTRGAGRPGR